MYRWTDISRTAIIRIADEASIPSDTGNSDYRAYLEWIAAGNVASPYAAPAQTASNVKAEAQRRIIVMTGAVDFNGCIVKQLNALMRVGELNNKIATGVALTEAEAAEAAALQSLANAIKAVRAKSNVIEAMSPIPADYAADERWA